jgi:RND family efflux transporter MFP subunit
MKALLILGLSALSTLASAQTTPKVLTIEPTTVNDLFTLEAKVEAVHESTISAQTSGRIQSVAFDVNDYVEKGAIIVQLRDKQQRAALEQAQAGLVQAKAANLDAQSKLEQSTPLFKQGSISKGQFDTIQANAKSAAAAVKASQALLKQAKENMAYTQIRAPYSGIVKARMVEVGESVAPGTSIMTGLSLSKLRVTADIPQRLAPHLSDKKGFKVINQNDEITTEKVIIFPYADPNSHSFKVRVDINAPNSKLFPGMWVKLQVPTGEKTVINIPKTALIQKGELSAVYVQNKNGFSLRQVRVGNEQQGTLEILAGLRAGESIAINGYDIMAAQERK